MPRLFVERGPDRGKELLLRAGQQVIAGRDAAASFPLSDAMCSRRHFAVGEMKGNWLIKDMGSVNGTLLNGKPLDAEKAQKLELGASIQAGDSLISFLPTAHDGTDDPLIGAKLGGYRIDQRLGRGAMGVVYRAHQLSLGRDVALKVLSDDVAHDAKFTAMFVKEARAAATLNHQNILQVYDVAQADGKLFIAMELATGGSVLDELRVAGTIRLDRSIEIMLDALAALEYAEKKALVHRDIKPDNLMITSDRTVKLGDLGLAASTAELGEVQSGVFGTPHYIAPEQAQGKAVDHRADLYSLGASWYRMLTGSTLFQGDSIKDILKAQVRERHRPLREIAPDVPAAISAIADRMLEKDPDKRYQSATQVMEDLRSFTSNRHGTSAALGGFAQAAPSGYSPDAAPVIVVRPTKKAPVGLLVGVAVAVIAIVVAIFVLPGLLADDDGTNPPSGGNGTTLPPPPPKQGDRDKDKGKSKQRESSPEAARRLGGAQILESNGKFAEALAEYDYILTHFSTSLEAEEALTKAAAIHKLVDKQRDAIGNFKLRWDELLVEVSDKLAPTYRLSEADTKFTAFANDLEAVGTPEAEALLGELDPKKKAESVKGEITAAFAEALNAPTQVINRISATAIQDRPAIIAECVAKATELRDMTDSDELKKAADERISEWTSLKSQAEQAVADWKTQIRVDAAAAATRRFMAAATEIAKQSSAFEYRRAEVLLDQFVEDCAELKEYATATEFEGLREMIADRRHQTALQEAAIDWLSRTWRMKGTQSIAGNRDIQRVFPGMTEIQLFAVNPDADRGEHAVFRYNARSESGQFTNRNLTQWRSLAAGLAGPLIEWGVRQQDSEDPDSAVSQLAVGANQAHRLGLGAQLLECGHSKFAHEMIEGAYSFFAKPGADPAMARRAREYMAYALAARAIHEKNAGDDATANDLLTRLLSDEFEGTRVRNEG